MRQTTAPGVPTRILLPLEHQDRARYRCEPGGMQSSFLLPEHVCPGFFVRPRINHLIRQIQGDWIVTRARPFQRCRE